MAAKRYTVGIDEAGRGPVIGPLVMVALAADEEGIKNLSAIGVKDSKALTPEQRTELFSKIRHIVSDYRVEMIEASAIDAALTDPNLNLNWLEADCAVRMVNELRPKNVIIDCPSPNIAAYKDYVLARLAPETRTVNLIMEHKADARHVIVAAASIVAKVIRDQEIERIKEITGINCGSGYLTDPRTIAFLDQHFETHEEFFRKHWASYQQRLQLKQQKKLGDFTTDDDVEVTGT
jgi:ribonuclease HII